jgi:hypothetical protein
MAYFKERFGILDENELIDDNKHYSIFVKSINVTEEASNEILKHFLLKSKSSHSNEPAYPLTILVKYIDTIRDNLIY